MWNGYGAIDAYDLCNLAGAIYYNVSAKTFDVDPYTYKVKTCIRIEIINSRSSYINNLLEKLKNNGHYKLIYRLYKISDGHHELIKQKIIIPNKISFIITTTIWELLDPGSEYRVVVMFISDSSIPILTPFVIKTVKVPYLAPPGVVPY